MRPTGGGGKGLALRARLLALRVERHDGWQRRVRARRAPGRKAAAGDIGELFDAAWPSDACTGLPASAWAALADHDEARARRALAASDVPTAELWRWLRLRGNGVPLCVVAGALRERRVAPAPELLAPPPTDPVVAALLLGLAAEHDPATKTSRIVGQLEGRLRDQRARLRELEAERERLLTGG